MARNYPLRLLIPKHEKPFTRKGVTLMEILIVVMIIGLLGKILFPKMGNMIRIAHDGSTKAHLGMIRSALNIYYSDNLARFPSDSPGFNQPTLAKSLVPKYLKDIPESYVTPYHARTKEVDNFSSITFQADKGTWQYFSSKNGSDWGLVVIRCPHLDTKGKVWTSY